MILLGLVTGVTVTSCLSDDEAYNAGFVFSNPTSPYTYLYANNTSDSLIMQCLGPWQITTSTPDASWCKIEKMSGRGNAIYSLQVDFEQNNTGNSRNAQFMIRDTDHPDKAYSSWVYIQYATRGDGSLGNAALVRSIQSSDGYVATIEYDEKARPVKYVLTNSENPLAAEQMTLSYDEYDNVLTVVRNGNELKGSMDDGYQTQRLEGANDTIGYYSQYYNNGMPVSANYAFNFVGTSNSRGKQAFSYLLNGQSLSPDSLHNTDSLKYVRQWRGEEDRYTEMLKMEYSKLDNRCQSVDVNQLLLGFAECHSMQLLSLFRYTRSTSIVARALSAKGNIEVATELNADKSVHRMVVSDRRNGTEVTYQFTY